MYTFMELYFRLYTKLFMSELYFCKPRKNNYKIFIIPLYIWNKKSHIIDTNNLYKCLCRQQYNQTIIYLLRLSLAYILMFVRVLKYTAFINFTKHFIALLLVKFYTIG